MWFRDICMARGGFSLTEALVALAITGATLGVGYEVFSNSLEVQRLASQKMRAVAIAQAKLSESDISDDWQNLNGSGVISDFYAWRREARPILEGEPRPGTKIQLIPIEVVVEVKWPASGGAPRSLRFYSVRLFWQGQES